MRMDKQYADEFLMANNTANACTQTHYGQEFQIMR